MEHVIVRLANGADIPREWIDSSRDGRLFDLDVLEHDSTFSLEAFGTKSRRMAFLPVQQPLMLESLVCRPGLNPAQTAQALSRLVEYAIGEAFRRDVGELYFLSRDPETCQFASRHKFRNLVDVDPEMQVYRLNLRETFGIS